MSKAAEESLRVLAQHCFTLADVAEDVAAALDHKNPKGVSLCAALLGWPSPLRGGGVAGRVLRHAAAAPSPWRSLLAAAKRAVLVASPTPAPRAALTWSAA